MPIDITNKEEKQIALTGAEIEETLLQAHLSKDAIAKIEGLKASASEIDGNSFGERSIPNGFDISLLPNFRVWKDRNSGIFKTNVKAERLFEDIFADKIVYVKTSGNDTTGDGSYSNPYRSLYKGLRTKPFDPSSGGKLTVYIETGIYLDTYGWNSTGIYADKINIIGYGGLVTSKQTANNYNGYMYDDKSSYTENIIFDGGKNAFNFENRSVSYCFHQFKNCVFKNSKLYDGINIRQNGLYILENCLASLNYYDGFNYHNYNSTITNQTIIEVNCKGISNGLSGSGTNNGSTMHNGGNIIRINGEYYNNADRNVHDVNNCHSWNLGCNSYNGQKSGEGNWVIGEYSDSSIMWLDSCNSSGTINNDIYKKGTESLCYVYNFTGTGGVVGDTGTPYLYNE